MSCNVWVVGVWVVGCVVAVCCHYDYKTKVLLRIRLGYEVRLGIRAGLYRVDQGYSHKGYSRRLLQKARSNKVDKVVSLIFIFMLYLSIPGAISI